MTDIERAVNALAGHSIACVKGDILYTHDAKGIAPMMEFIGRGIDLRGFAVADTVVGKAVAMLFAYAGVSKVNARIISVSARETLYEYGIPCTFDKEVGYIVNRRGDGRCPMETAVADIDDCEQAYDILKRKLDELRG